MPFIYIIIYIYSDNNKTIITQKEGTGKTDALSFLFCR